MTRENKCIASALSCMGFGILGILSSNFDYFNVFVPITFHTLAIASVAALFYNVGHETFEENANSVGWTDESAFQHSRTIRERILSTPITPPRSELNGFFDRARQRRIDETLERQFRYMEAQIERMQVQMERMSESSIDEVFNRWRDTTVTVTPHAPVAPSLTAKDILEANKFMQTKEKESEPKINLPDSRLRHIE